MEWEGGRERPQGLETPTVFGRLLKGHPALARSKALWPIQGHSEDISAFGRGFRFW
jgi:hypothetical protein